MSHIKPSKSDDVLIQVLCQHLAAIPDNQEMEAALCALLTPAELLDIARRLEIFRLLDSGMPQRQIAQQLGVAIATVTRGSKAQKMRDTSVYAPSK